jgi:hypothetical protein
MITLRNLCAIFVSLFLLVFLSACKDEQVDPPLKPADLEYIGTWSGNTSEGLLVMFDIDTINQRTRVKKAVIKYYRDSAKHSQIIANTEGLAKVDSGKFTMALGGNGFIDGHFNNENLLTGTMLIDDKMRFFSCTNEAGKSTINSISQASYRFRENKYFFRQDHYDTLNRLEENLTYFHRKFFKSSLKPRPPIDDSIRLIQITKGRLSDIWNAEAFVQFFTPGKRNYSNGAQNGIEIVIFDARDNFKKWSTSLDSANQQGSRFEILETIKLENDLNHKVIVKLIAEFDCMMYDSEGNAEPLTEGRFIGLFEQELEK